jgi:hypothetical protein
MERGKGGGGLHTPKKGSEGAGANGGGSKRRRCRAVSGVAAAAVAGRCANLRCAEKKVYQTAVTGTEGEREEVGAAYANQKQRGSMRKRRRQQTGAAQGGKR